MLKLKLQYLATWCKELTHWKRPWCWERLKEGGEGDNRRWDGWMASPTRWTWVWVSSGSWWWKGSLACCSPWGRKKSDMTEWLNWTHVHTSALGVHAVCTCVCVCMCTHTLLYIRRKAWRPKTWEHLGETKCCFRPISKLKSRYKDHSKRKMVFLICLFEFMK